MQSRKAERGDKVRIHYEGRTPRGEVFVSSKNQEPITFTLGKGAVIEGLDEALVGMSPGETKTALIPAEKAYGRRDSAKVGTLPPSQVRGDVSVGEQVEVLAEGGRHWRARVTEINDEGVTVDANHPLAGRDVTFDLQLLEIL